MALISITDLGAEGINSDLSPELLPPNLWSGGKNIDFNDRVMGNSLGYTSSGALGVPVVPPLFVTAARDAVDFNNYIVYAGTAKAYAIISGIHNNITRTSGAGIDLDYSSSAGNAWQSTVINGILVMNNGTDAPQKWTRATGTVRMQNIDGWTATWKATVVRAFKPYLIALDITKGTTRFPQMVKWSHAAAFGAIPTSWDETDPTLDAGETTLAETQDWCIDCGPLQDLNIIYKEKTTWGQQFIGFPGIFRFFRLFSESGILSRNCWVEIMGQHVVLTESDVILHNGASIESIANQKIRRELFNRIDTDTRDRCFVTVTKFSQEVYIGIPATASYPDTAFVWNRRSNTWSIRDLPNANAMAVGVEAFLSGSSLWDTTVGTWDAFVGAWNAGSFSSDLLVAASSQNNKLYRFNSGTTADGGAFTATVERTGLDFTDPSLQRNTRNLKMIRSIRPVFSSSGSPVINIELGTQLQPTDPVTWGTAIAFNPYVDREAYFFKTARYFGIRFSSISQPQWKLKEYYVDVEFSGSL